MIMDLWLIIFLIYFGVKTKKWRRLQPGNPNSLSSGRIYLSVIICSVTTFLCHLFIAVYRNVGFNQNEAQLCKVISDMVDITYSSSFLSVILFLWFRQRTLYTAFWHASLNLLNISALLYNFCLLLSCRCWCNFVSFNKRQYSYVGRMCI